MKTTKLGEIHQHPEPSRVAGELHFSEVSCLRCGVGAVLGFVADSHPDLSLLTWFQTCLLSWWQITSGDWWLTLFLLPRLFSCLGVCDGTLVRKDIAPLFLVMVLSVFIFSSCHLESLRFFFLTWLWINLPLVSQHCRVFLGHCLGQNSHVCRRKFKCYFHLGAECCYLFWVYLNVAVPEHPRTDIWRNCSAEVARATLFSQALVSKGS